MKVDSSLVGKYYGKKWKKGQKYARRFLKIQDGPSMMLQRKPQEATPSGGLQCGFLQQDE